MVYGVPGSEGALQDRPRCALGGGGDSPLCASGHRKLQRYTARLYTDLGFLTCDEEIADDATHFFNALTGYAAKQDYQKLLVAPVGLREGLEELIRREIKLHESDGQGHLIFKMNALDPPRLHGG